MEIEKLNPKIKERKEKERTTKTKNKAKLQAEIDEELLQRFRRFLIDNFGSTYYLGFVIEEAIKQYMDSFDASAHAHITQQMQISKKHIKLDNGIGTASRSQTRYGINDFFNKAFSELR